MITDAQHLALVARAAFNGTAHDRFHKGVRDASAALRKILENHAENRAGLRAALRDYLAEGPAWDSSDYEDGGACVHGDVLAVLDGDRETIAQLLATLTEGKS